MILMWCTFGLANRMFFFGRCMELAEATGQTVICFNFPEAADFEGVKNGELCRWPVPDGNGFQLTNFLRRCCTTTIRRYVPLTRKWPWLRPHVVWSNELNGHESCAQNPRFVEEVKSRRLTILTGWFSLENLEIPNHEQLRAFFTPREPVRTQCREIAARARDGADILIGVHARWGDYTHYAGGAFYFPPETYIALMRHCASLFPGRTVSFLIVTNEPEKITSSMASFHPMKITLGPGTKLGDIYSLAECDYIVCPQSTFSLWAAFYGRKPCWSLQQDIEFPALSDFVVPDSNLGHLHLDNIAGTGRPTPRKVTPAPAEPNAG